MSLSGGEPTDSLFLVVIDRLLSRSVWPRGWVAFVGFGLGSLESEEGWGRDGERELP